MAEPGIERQKEMVEEREEIAQRLAQLQFRGFYGTLVVKLEGGTIVGGEVTEKFVGRRERQRRGNVGRGGTS